MNVTDEGTVKSSTTLLLCCGKTTLAKAVSITSVTLTPAGVEVETDGAGVDVLGAGVDVLGAGVEVTGDETEELTFDDSPFPPQALNVTAANNATRSDLLNFFIF